MIIKFGKIKISRRKILFTTRKVISVLLILLISFQSNSQLLGSIVFAQESDESTASATLEKLENSILASSSGDLEIFTDNEKESFPSAQYRKKSSIRRLQKKDFSADESIKIIVDNTLSSEEYNMRIVDTKNEVLDAQIRKTVEDTKLTFDVIPPDRAFVPGKYTIEVESEDGTVLKQDFTWGVLAINTNKSIYLPEEKAKMQFAVLDETGMMVCDAKVELEILSPEHNIYDVLSTENGGIKVNPECSVKGFVETADYEAEYKVSGRGSYEMVLSAVTPNGEYSITDKLTVRESVPFDVERISSTRIYPAAEYDVVMEITANDDFSGVVTEAVPFDFSINESEKDGVLTHDSIGEEIILNTSESVLGVSDGLSMPFEGDFPVSLYFGEELVDPFLVQKYNQFGVIGHDGIDFPLPSGTNVISVDDGVVVLAEENHDYGTTIVIEHEWGKSYYGHLGELHVKAGDNVRSGDVIGLSGSTGLSTGPHLHFGIKPKEHDMQNGYYGKVDPAIYLGLTPKGEVLGLSDSVSRDSKKVIKWNLELKKGETVKIGYKYKAPEISPQFYLIGPLTFIDSTNSFVFKEERQWQIAVDPVTIDATVSTAVTEHNGSSPTVVFTTDTTGYAFYVDSNGACVYSKTTNGGTSWGTAVTVDAQTDCTGIAVWYDRWTPGDTTGTRIHITTFDTSTDDVWYRALNTSGDTFDAAVVNASGAGQGAAVAAGANNVTITKATNGTLYIGLVDATDSYVIRCSTTCGTATNWTEAGTNPFTNADGDWVILMPLASGDILAIWWDTSVDDILSREYEDTGNVWDPGGWVTVDANADDNTTYDSSFAATLDPDNNNIYLAYAEDASALGPSNDDIKTATYNGSSWTAGGNVLTDEPFRGVTGVTISYDNQNDHVYVSYTVQETVNYNMSANAYSKRSRDGMATWGSERGPLNGSSDDIYGLRSNLVSTERILATWIRSTPDDLFGTTIADISSGDHIYVGHTDAQVDSMNQGSTNNYVGGAFTFVRSATSANVTSIKITDTGTINANTYLSNLDIYYETAGTCTYDGTETLFGTDTAFDASDTATVTGTMSVGTSQVCVYLVVDVGSGDIGTIELEIANPGTDVIVSAGDVPDEARVRLSEPTNVRQSSIATRADIDITAQTAFARHAGPQPTVVFTTDQIGYSFYNDSDGRCRYSKTTNGGTSWAAGVIVDNQTDCIGIGVWYDQWTPGDTTGTFIHVVTWDTSTDDTWYTRLDTSTDTVTTSVSASGTGQGGALVAGANAGSITKSTNGTLYIGIVDATDSYVIRCSTTCTTGTNWTEAGTSPFTAADSDYVLLMPLASDDILAIWWDASADDILSREYEDIGNTWGAGWTTIDAAADENVNYDAAYAATLDKDTNTIYLAYIDDESFLSDENGDIKTWSYDGATWTAGGNVLTNSIRGLTKLAISYDSLNDDVYVVYSAITDTTNFRTAAVYFKSSSDGMSTWGVEQGSLTSTAEREIYGLRTNLFNSDRLYVTWYEAQNDDILGNTVVDLSTGGAETPSLNQLMRHGKWFNSSGVRQPFTF